MFHFMTRSGRTIRIGLIGLGAVGDEVVRCLDRRGELSSLVGVLELPERCEAAREKAARRFPVFDKLDDLMARDPQIVIEAAGHNAVIAVGAEILSRGCDLLVASVGAARSDCR
jgi:aspartate dehydrogenase